MFDLYTIFDLSAYGRKWLACADSCGQVLTTYSVILKQIQATYWSGLYNSEEHSKRCLSEKFIPKQHSYINKFTNNIHIYYMLRHILLYYAQHSNAERCSYILVMTELNTIIANVLRMCFPHIKEAFVFGQILDAR